MIDSNTDSRGSETALSMLRRAGLRAASLALAGWLFLPGLTATTALTSPAWAAQAERPLASPSGEVLRQAAAGTEFHAFDDQLAWIINVALPQSPEVREARARWRAERARIDHAAALPDPKASYRYFGGTPETRVGPQQHALGFSQQVPGFGKRKLRRTLAEFGADIAAWKSRDAERLLVAEIKRAYFEAAYALEALRVNREETALLERFEGMALQRYSSGVGIQQRVIKIQTDLSRLVDEQLMLAQHLDHLTHRLSQLMGDPERTLLLTPIDLTLRDIDLSSVGDAHHQLAGHRGTAALRTQADHDHAVTRLASLSTRPNFRFTASYVDVGTRTDPGGVLNPPHGNGDDIWSLGIEITLPIYRRSIRSNVQAAQERQRASAERLRRAEDHFGHEIHGALVTMESLERRISLHEDVIVPQAGQSLSSAEASYSSGKLGFQELLDAQRVLFQARLSTERLRADYWIAAAEMELYLARKFPDTVSGEGAGS